ncbi:MAG: cytidylate kinase-like family protein [Lachnospiraceae bacterium]|nr:cytidylate kinase-like family protein [Lachnospiraceae bacterium]
MMPIITISRETGSNGSRIGEMVAKELNIPVIDKYFIEELRKKTGYSPSHLENKGEYLSQFDFFLNAQFYNGLYLGDEQNDLYHIQRNIILEEAKKGPCVIIGRCADAILADEKIPSLNVFIHADMEYRIRNYRERFPNHEATLEKLMKKKDKGRKAYYRFYTDREWGDVSNYDLALDSGRLGEEMCKKLIIVAAQERAEIK